MISRKIRIGVAFACAFGMTGSAQAQDNLKVMVFSGVQNMPIIAAQTKGYFAKRGLNVEVLPAPSSDALRNGLAEGKHQIVHAGVDNAVAMVEVAKADISILMGGDSGWNRFFVQADTPSIKDLRGKTVIVDSPTTSFAFQVYQILKLNGLNKGDYEVRSGRRDAAAIRSDQERQDCRRLNAQSAILDSGEARRPERHGRDRADDRSVSGDGGMGDEAVGERECRCGGAIHPGLYRRIALDARSRQQGGSDQADRVAIQAGAAMSPRRRTRSRPIPRAAWRRTPSSTWTD